MKQNAPLVTVITPTFDRAALLKVTAESILRQTYPFIEYLIVDDGSTEDIGAIFRALSPRHGHVVRLISQARGGEAAAINKAWQMASGEFVAIVSSDDPQPDHWLEVCIAYLEEHPNAVAGYPDWTMIGEAGEPLHTISLPPFDRLAMIETLQCFPGPGTLIRRQFVKDALLRRPGLPHCSDFDCWLRLCLYGDFVHIPTVAANWRSHAGGFSASNGSAWYEDMRTILRDFFARPDLPNEVRALRRIAKANLRYEAARKLWRSNLLRASWLLATAICLTPTGSRFTRYWPARWRLKSRLSSRARNS